MIPPAVKEWVVPPLKLGDLLDHPLRGFSALLLSSVAAGLFHACLVRLSGLIKARLCNSSSSTSVPPMAMDQAGIRRWTSKIAPTCRSGLLSLLQLVEWEGWIYLLVRCLQEGTWLVIIVWLATLLLYCAAMVSLKIIFVKGPIIAQIILVKIFNRQWRQPTRNNILVKKGQ